MAYTVLHRAQTITYIVVYYAPGLPPHVDAQWVSQTEPTPIPVGFHFYNGRFNQTFVYNPTGYWSYWNWVIGETFTITLEWDDWITADVGGSWNPQDPFNGAEDDGPPPKAINPNPANQNPAVTKTTRNFTWQLEST